MSGPRCPARGVHEAEGDDPALLQAHERKPRLPAPARGHAGEPSRARQVSLFSDDEEGR